MTEQAVSQTQLQKYPLAYRGKVRDLYDLGDRLLMVATDRLSAFDYVLPSPVPGKGKLLTELSVFWFKQTQSILPNHLISTDVSPYVASAEEQKMLEGRTMVVKKAKRLDVEAIVRAYLTGSAYKDYEKTGEVNGMKLPKGLRNGDPLPEILFTPSTKAEVGTHDEPLTFAQVEDLLGSEHAQQVREAALKIFKIAAQKAESKGLILVDTKMEFGLLNDQLILIDELLTQDSSRFWLASEYAPGKALNPWDKQLVRDYLLKSDWDRKSPPPPLPQNIIEETLFRYKSIAERLMA